MTTPPTHDALCRLAARWLRRRGCTVVLVEPQTLRTAEFPDAIGWRWHTSWLVECKVSRSDFHRDKKKFHRQPGWGLLEARHGRVFEVQRPADLQPNGFPREPTPPETLRSEMALLLAQLERVAQGRPTHVQRAKDPPVTVPGAAADILSSLAVAQELRVATLLAAGAVSPGPSPTGGTVAP